MSDIKFNTFNVTNKATGKKARVHYSLDNTTEFFKSGVKSITIYDRDYGHALGEVFTDSGLSYRNDTDSMTDYFDKGVVRIFETDAIFAAARKAVEAILAKQQAKRDAKVARREAARRVVLRAIPGVHA